MTTITRGTHLMLSAIEAIREGRELYPEFVSGALVNLVDATGEPTFWSSVKQRWEKWANRAQTHTTEIEGKPICGSACLLGAQALGMGTTLQALSTKGSYFAHPDFFTNPEDRARHPNGFQYGGVTHIELAQQPNPCSCSGYGKGTPQDIPRVIAHLNDLHDPRTSPRLADPWPEARIIGWLQSLGYR